MALVIELRIVTLLSSTIITKIAIKGDQVQGEIGAAEPVWSTQATLFQVSFFFLYTVHPTCRDFSKISGQFQFHPDRSALFFSAFKTLFDCTFASDTHPHAQSRPTPVRQAPLPECKRLHVNAWALSPNDFRLDSLRIRLAKKTKVVLVTSVRISVYPLFTFLVETIPHTQFTNCCF